MFDFKHLLASAETTYSAYKTRKKSKILAADDGKECCFIATNNRVCYLEEHLILLENGRFNYQDTNETFFSLLTT